MPPKDSIIDRHEPVLITGSNGFIGSRVVAMLLRYGFRNLRCFVRPSSNLTALDRVCQECPEAAIEVMPGNLLSPQDCAQAVKDAALIIHLAAGGDKSFPGSFMNTVVTTRNLLDAVLEAGCLKRFVNVSSFAIYSNRRIRRGGMLDESCSLEDRLVERGEAYVYSKLKQEELANRYAAEHSVPVVTVRPGAVFGPGKGSVTGRIGIDTFGIYLHLGGWNHLPLSYVDNCAEAIVLAGLRPGVDGEVFNVVDSEQPRSRQVLRLHKKAVGGFRSLYVPYRLFYLFCWMWEAYSRRSKGQIPAAFNRYRCSAYWKGNRYSNQKLKSRLDWQQRYTFEEAWRNCTKSLAEARLVPS